MDCHLVAVEIGVKSGTNQWMYLDSAPVDKYRFESLDAKAVQGRCPVKQHRSLFNDLFQDIVNLCFGSLYQSPGAFDIRSQSLRYQAPHDEGFKEFQCHASRQSALV